MTGDFFQTFDFFQFFYHQFFFFTTEISCSSDDEEKIITKQKVMTKQKAIKATKKAAPKKLLNAQQKASLLAKMTILLRLVEAFLMNEELKENGACKTELLYPQLLKRKQFALFHRNMTKDNKVLTAKTAKDVKDYAQKFRMESEHLLYLHHKELLRTEDNMPELIESLDVCYLINKLSVFIIMVNMIPTIFFTGPDKAIIF